MKENFDKSLARVLVYEGGLSNNPRDPGGVTNKGITQNTYRAWLVKMGRPNQSVAKITQDEVAVIYKTEYWDRVNGDMLPSGVDFCVFDAAVNSGVGSAASWAQAVCGITVDGSFGTKTTAAVQAADPEDFIHNFDEHRLGTLQRLSTWSTFGKGWSARIANVQKTAVAMAEDGEAPEPVPVSIAGGNVKNRLSDVPISNTAVITAHASTVGGMVATAAAQAGQSLSGVPDGVFSWLKYVLGGITIVGAIAASVVYFSKAANDAASNGVAKAKVDPDADTALVPAPAVVPIAKAA